MNIKDSYFVFLKNGSVLHKYSIEEINGYLRDQNINSDDIARVVKGVGLARRTVDNRVEIIDE